jgi:hypothetical protein
MTDQDALAIGQRWAGGMAEEDEVHDLMVHATDAQLETVARMLEAAGLASDAHGLRDFYRRCQ